MKCQNRFIDLNVYTAVTLQCTQYVGLMLQCFVVHVLRESL